MHAAKQLEVCREENVSRAWWDQVAGVVQSLPLCLHTIENVEQILGCLVLS